MQTFTTLPGYTSVSIYALEEDLLHPGYFLAALENSIVQFTPLGSMTILAGDPIYKGYVNSQGTQARFSSTLGMCQLPDRTVLIADHGNDCIRSLNRDSNAVTTFSGNCTDQGYVDGSLSQAKFTRPQGIHAMDDMFNQIAVIEWLHGRIRYLYIQEQLVTTAGTLGVKLSFLLKGPDYFYISADYGVMEVIGGTARWLSGSSVPSSADGPFESASYIDPEGMSVIGSRSILVADRKLHKIRFLNRQNNTVTSFCSGDQGYVDGSLSSCKLSNPFSLLVTNTTIYIGEAGFNGGGIRKISYQSKLSLILEITITT